MERVIRVSHSNSGGHPPKKLNTEVMKTEDQSGNMISMQHQMEEELERRRKDWEKEVEKMQEEFFDIKLPKNNKINANRTIEVQAPAVGVSSASSRMASKGMDILEIGNAKTIYTESDNGQKMVKFNFDVRGFDPNAITVRAEGSRLTVSAQYEEECYPGSKNTRKHNRQVDIPRGVDPDMIVSRLSADGILTVEAPVNESEDDDEEDDDNSAEIHVFDNSYLHGQPTIGFNEYTRMPSSTMTHNYSTPRTERIISHSRTSGGKKSPKFVRGESKTVTPGGIIVYRSSVGDVPSPTDHTSQLTSKRFDFGDPNIVSTEEGHRLKISVTLGTVYKPEEITVKLLYKKIIVKAVHEEVIAGRSSKSEFSREFDIPGPVEPRTFKAVLSDEGKLAIGGSLSENTNHDAVMALVYCDMPLRGRAVKVTNH